MLNEDIVIEEETIYKAQERQPLQKKASGSALALIGGGIALLIVTLSGGDIMEYIWPFFIIGPGLLMLRPAYLSTPKRPSRLAFLAVPGAFFTTVGTLLFVMNLTDHFESWAYAWTLLPAAVMAGVMYMKRYDEASSVHTSGYKFIRVMLILFMVLAAFFELIIFESLGPWWPLLMIGAGLYLYARDRNKA